MFILWPPWEQVYVPHIRPFVYLHTVSPSFRMSCWSTSIKREGNSLTCTGTRSCIHEAVLTEDPIWNEILVIFVRSFRPGAMLIKQSAHLS